MYKILKIRWSSCELNSNKCLSPLNWDEIDEWFWQLNFDFVEFVCCGYGHTSSMVEWVIAELIRHPKIMAQAQQELDSVVGKDRYVNESDISQLPFVQAIVKETFRLHPSTPLSLPWLANESCEVNGYSIPKGSALLVNVWAIARDPNIWSNPLKFQPERFLQNPNIDVKGNNFELKPFGSGRRICAGMNLGLQMVQLLQLWSMHLILVWAMERWLKPLIWRKLMG